MNSLQSPQMGCLSLGGFLDFLCCLSLALNPLYSKHSWHQAWAHSSGELQVVTGPQERPVKAAALKRARETQLLSHCWGWFWKDPVILSRRLGLYLLRSFAFFSKVRWSQGQLDIAESLGKLCVLSILRAKVKDWKIFPLNPAEHIAVQAAGLQPALYHTCISYSEKHIHYFYILRLTESNTLWIDRSYPMFGYAGNAKQSNPMESWERPVRHGGSALALRQKDCRSLQLALASQYIANCKPVWT